ncbi:MAG: RNA polymerase sigma factor [Planctomycetaceae bacterium]
MEPSVDPHFRALYEREFDAVVRAAYLLCGDAHLAQDASQEAFARALARWRRLQHHPSPGGWVTTTALNVVRRSLRRRPAEVPAEGVAIAADLDDRLAVRAAVRSLPRRQQEAVVLHYLLDLPVAETAAAMGVDAGTVKTHLSRARGSIARLLRDDDPEELPR